MKVSVPSEFMLHHPFNYPSDNFLTFEEWYASQPIPESERDYLPIFWTSYYCKWGYGSQPGKINALQEFINSLDKGKKYYTIIQYDNGILNDVSGLDIKVFSMSGSPIDYPLPLLCQPHRYHPFPHRDILCSFAGRNTHALRTELFKITHRGYLITDHPYTLHQFCDILSRSVFTLCPRGFGPSSFRICEAMQYGSIPVYISDLFIEPHNIDFNTYGVKIFPDQIKDLVKILSGVNIQEKQTEVKKAYKMYYTYEANKQLIDKECSN